MQSIMKSAAKGSVSAMMGLYEQNRSDVWFLCDSLMRDESEASRASVNAFKRAFVDVTNGVLESEEEFTRFTLRRAVAECKLTVLWKNKKAFKTPSGYNYTPVFDPNKLIANQDWSETVLAALPELHRFVCLSASIAGLSPDEIAKTMEISEKVVEKVLETEGTNIDRVCLLSPSGPTEKHTAEEFHRCLARRAKETMIPGDVDERIEKLIREICGPLQKRKLGTFIGAGVICAAVVVFLAAVILPTALRKTPDFSDEPPASGEESGVEDSDTTVDDEAQDGDSGAQAVHADYYAAIDIADYGTVTVALDAGAAPKTVENFVTLAQSGFYDGLTFHRIIDGFMMQGGDPEGNGTGGAESTITGEFSVNGFDNPLSHTRGAISMARSDDYNSASSQFFIVQEDSTYLDGQYAVFGYVTEGMDIVDAICSSAQPTDSNGTIPSDQQPVITSITVTPA